MKKQPEKEQEKDAVRWYINLDWYQQNQRSFPTLAKKYLCPKCAGKIGGAAGVAPEKVITAIGNCCSKVPEFVTERTPILERIFCVFLSNDNRPINLEELGNQLNRWHGFDTFLTSPEILNRLLTHDQYYGFGKVGAQ